MANERDTQMTGDYTDELTAQHTAAIAAFLQAKTKADEDKAMEEIKRIEAILFTRGG